MRVVAPAPTCQWDSATAECCIHFRRLLWPVPARRQTVQYKTGYEAWQKRRAVRCWPDSAGAPFHQLLLPLLPRQRLQAPSAPAPRHS